MERLRTVLSTSIELQGKFSELVHSVQQRLKWASGANHNLSEVRTHDSTLALVQMASVINFGFNCKPHAVIVDEDFWQWLAMAIAMIFLTA